MVNESTVNLGKITQEADGALEAPERIIQTVAMARAIVDTLRSNHIKRTFLYEAIEGLFQGNPPYSKTDLAAAGLESIANFNDMSARAVFERYALAYFNLLYNAQYVINFTIRGKNVEFSTMAKIMSQHWDETIREMWPSFAINCSTLTAQLVKFGISPALFPDEDDFRWRVIEASKFYIPDQSQADLDMLTTIAVESKFTLQYLWGVYKEFHDKDADTHPWNIPALGRLLVMKSGCVDPDQGDNFSYFDVAKALNNGDLSANKLYNESITIVSLLQKEYNEKITHYMFSRDTSIGRLADSTTPGIDCDKSGFLFVEDGQYDTMYEALILFTMNPGEYTIHGNKGLGQKIFSLAQAKIQMDCSVVDMAKWASTPIIKSSSMNAKDVEQIRFYPGVPTNIGSADFVQNNLGANVQNVIGAAQYLSSAIQFNLTYSGSDPGSPDPDTGSMSPTETKLRAFKEFSVMKNGIMHFYASFDKILQNMVLKMLKCKEGDPSYDVAQEWKERCIEDNEAFAAMFEEWKIGDKKKLPRGLKVRATRAAGAGSQVAHLMSLEAMQPITGSFTVEEAREYKKQYIMAAGGPEMVDTFLTQPTDDETTGGASLAGTENAIMQLNQPAIFSPDNAHRAHTATHLALLMYLAQGIQSGEINPIEADKIFALAIPHTEQHLSYLEGDPFAKEFYAKAINGFNQIKQLAILNRKNAVAMQEKQAKEQQQAQEQQQQVMSKEQLLQMQAEADIQRKNRDSDEKIARQNDAHLAKKNVMFDKAITEKQIKTFRAESDVEVKKTLADADVSVKAGTAQANVNIQAAKTAADVETDRLSVENDRQIGVIEQLNKQTLSEYDFE